MKKLLISLVLILSLMLSMGLSAWAQTELTEDDDKVNVNLYINGKLFANYEAHDFTRFVHVLPTSTSLNSSKTECTFNATVSIRTDSPADMEIEYLSFNGTRYDPNPHLSGKTVSSIPCTTTLDTGTGQAIYSSFDIYLKCPSIITEDGASVSTPCYMNLANNVIVTSGGSIEQNLGVITENYGKVDFNYGTVTNKADSEGNSGYVDINESGTVYNHDGGSVNTNENFGTVYNYRGGVVTDNYGTVHNFDNTSGDNSGATTFYYQPLILSGEIDKLLNLTYSYGEIAPDAYLWLREDKGYVSFSFPEGYAISVSGQCFIENDENGNVTISKFETQVELNISKLPPAVQPAVPGGPGELDPEVSPAPVTDVPATGDMSNLPLWSALLLLFAVTAIVTKKKKA